MNQRPLTTAELAYFADRARAVCAALDKAEAVARAGMAKRWYAAELVARHVIWRARHARSC